MADPVLKPATVPPDVPLPTSATQLVNLVAHYLSLEGLAGLQGVIISDTEPAVTDRDKAWVKIDPANGRAIGLFRYSGGWKQLPLVPESGENEPANPRNGEVFYNTKAKALKGYLDGAWTTELWHKGTKSERPTGVPLGYLYFDSDIKRLLRWTANGWSTVDGCIGELRMFGGISVSEAEERNPGWSVYAAMSGRFPVGQNDDFDLNTDGGRDKVAWSAKTHSAAGGGRDQGVLAEISIDGTAATGSANSQSTKTGEFSIIPPYRAVIFMRKEF